LKRQPNLGLGLNREPKPRRLGLVSISLEMLTVTRIEGYETDVQVRGAGSEREYSLAGRGLDSRRVDLAGWRSRVPGSYLAHLDSGSSCGQSLPWYRPPAELPNRTRAGHRSQHHAGKRSGSVAPRGAEPGEEVDRAAGDPPIPINRGSPSASAWSWTCHPGPSRSPFADCGKERDAC
jgi:hypothetical protein